MVEAMMQALTFVQPYATLMMLLGAHPAIDKNIENRASAPPRALIGKRFAVHAGMNWDEKDTWGLREKALGALAAAGHPTRQSAFPRSCILGTLELVGFVRFTPGQNGPSTPGRSEGLNGNHEAAVLQSRWLAPQAKAAWLVRAPLALAEPIHSRGMLGLWRVPAEASAKLEALHAI
jgi:hypothetical protein